MRGGRDGTKVDDANLQRRTKKEEGVGTARDEGAQIGGLEHPVDACFAERQGWTEERMRERVDGESLASTAHWSARSLVL